MPDPKPRRTSAIYQTIRCLDPSVHDEGECVPIDLEIKFDETDIHLTEIGHVGPEGFARSVWVEVQGGDLRVHCYDPEHEEPVSIRISSHNITIQTDREGGIDHVV